MTGPEHYRQAEARLEFAYRISLPDSGHTDEEATLLVGLALQRAQVHATLALAAATAMGQCAEMPVWDADAWQDLAGTRYRQQDGAQ